MAIKEQQEIPRELPIANLFLDDVAQIVKLFSMAMQYQDESGQVIQPETTFHVGRFLCDETEDLLKLGKRASDFTIFVGMKDRWQNGQVRLSRFSTSWDSFGIRDEWSVYGRLHELFEKRKCRWKNTLHSARSSAFFLFGCVTGLLIDGLLVLSFHSPRTGTHMAGLAAAVALLLPSLALGFGIFHAHSLVHFRYSYDPVPGWRQKVANWAPYLLAALMGAIVTKLAERFVRWIWP